MKMGQETRQKTAKKGESASDLWRRIEQSGLDNALKKLSNTKPELTAISSISSDDATNISGVITEFAEVLSCIRLAYADNEKEIHDGGEREERYMTSTCPTILEIWRAYSSFAAEFATSFVQSSWLNSSEHRTLLSAIVDMAANSAKLLVVSVDMKDFQSEKNADALYGAAISEAAYVCKVLEELLTKVFALGDSHSAIDGLMELAGWTLYGLTHVTAKVVRVGLEARGSDGSVDDHDELIDNVTSLLKLTKEKWSTEPSKSATPPPPPPPTVQEKKGSKEPPKTTEPTDTEPKRSKEGYLETLQKLGQVHQKYSDEAWETKRLPVLHGTAGVQLLYRMECYEELGRVKVDACPMSSRSRLLDSLSLTDGHVLHSDIFVTGPEPMECSKEVTLKFPLMSNEPAEGSEIYLKIKEGETWREVENPVKVTEDDQTYIVFNTTKCEAFTALSFSPSDALMVGPAGATYVSDDNSKVEVLVPQDCFSSDVTLGIKVIPFRMTDEKAFIGTVQGSCALELTPETEGMEMKKAITVQLPMKNNVDEKDTELVVVRYNESTVQVLDKKQMTVRMVDNGVYAVDTKGFWSIAILRIKRIFLNMRESIKKEFLIGYGMKTACNILTFIDDITRGNEKQTFTMEVVEKREAENTVDLRRQMGMVEVKRGRSKDILLKRGDRIMMVIDGQIRVTEALKDEDCTLCYIKGTSNVVSIPTEIKRDPEKFPDAMVIYKQCPSESWLHSLAIMTRDLAELTTEEIVARTSSNVPGMESSRSKLKDDGTNVLKMESLMSLARELTFDEASTLGQQLGVKGDKINQIKEENENEPVAGNFQILCCWRGRFARATMADFLISSLKAVGQPTYADLVAEVRKYNRCMKREDFEMARRKEKIIE